MWYANGVLGSGVFFGDKFPQILMNMSGKYTPSGGQISGKKKVLCNLQTIQNFHLGTCTLKISGKLPLKPIERGRVSRSIKCPSNRKSKSSPNLKESEYLGLAQYFVIW